MLESFGCCFFGPVIACTVVIVDKSGKGDVRHNHIGGAKAEVNVIFDALVCRHDFWFRQTEGGAVLQERFPREKASALSDNMARYGAEFIER